MNIRTLKLAAAALAITATGIASAQIRTLVEAVELSPANIIMPGSLNGMVTFRPCADECDEDYERARLTPDTQFVVDGSRVKFEDFSKGFAVIRQAKDGYALISVDTQTKTITRIEIKG
ncbi:MAG: hypothetical protein QNJ00_04880 [Woeseiaceae bacterium]|nr:hypothetical protein [Woeseiaceae bacterium]